jgi:hypothetical protein
MKCLLLFCLCPLFLFSQIQIGNDINGNAAQEQFGTSVSYATDDNILAIGAFGIVPGEGSNVRIYKYQDGAWMQQGNTIVPEGLFEETGEFGFGYCTKLSKDGSILAVGSLILVTDQSYSYKVSVYENIAGIWTIVGNAIGPFGLGGSPYGNHLGLNISLSDDGSIIAMGVSSSSNLESTFGYTRVYMNISGVWTQMGGNIQGENLGDQSGVSVSLSNDGDRLAIGASKNQGNSVLKSGQVRVYEYIDDQWQKIGSDIDGEAIHDGSGYSTSLSADGSIVAIGAPGNGDNGVNSGHVRVYKYLDDVWSQIGLDIDGEWNDDASGISVSLSESGQIVAIGANGNDDNGPNSGHVRVYQNISGTWSQLGRDFDGTDAGDLSGRSVCLSDDGSKLVIGSPGHDFNGEDSGQVRVYDLSALLSTYEFELAQFNLYPNPAKDRFTIQLKEGSELKRVNIYNHLAQLISTSQETIVNTSKLASGFYIVEVITNQGKATKKLIIE